MTVFPFSNQTSHLIDALKPETSPFTVRTVYRRFLSRPVDHNFLLKLESTGRDN